MSRLTSVVIVFSLMILLVLPLVASKDIAYVVKASNRADSKITNVITNSGYTYDVITETNIGSTNFSSYRLILVGNDIFQNPSRIPVNDQNSLILNQYHYYQKTSTDFQWGWSKEQSIVSRSFLQLDNNLNSSVGVLTQGVSSPFIAYTGSGVNAYVLGGQKPSGITYITYVGSLNNKDYIIALAEKNTLMLNGNRTKGRSLFFGLTNTDYWSADAEKMFKNSLEWSIKGQDRDADGFFDNDCNDNNASINPNATEIPYNRIDENCDGKDVADVDGDGYCKTGYVIMNKSLQCPNEGISTIGTDCDDGNIAINRGSSDLLNNCINDAPRLLSNISEFSWNEDESFEVNSQEILSHFADPEGDNLSVSISQISSNNVTYNYSDGIFTFKGINNWYGSGWVVFNVSDVGNLVSTNKIDLVVNSVNDAPVIDDINDIYFLVGELVNVNSNIIVSDIENDPINISLSYPLNNGPWQTNESDEGSYEVIVSASDSFGGVSEKSFNLIIMPKAVVNEIYSNSGNSWFEIYNPGNVGVNLQACNLDINGNNVNLSGILKSKGFYVIDQAYVVNTGDSVKLYCNNGLIDNVVFNLNTSIDNGKSYGRVLDGVDTGSSSDFKIYDLPTKNISNSADMIVPIVNLIDPLNNQTFNDRNINFNFNVSDNAENVSCELYGGNPESALSSLGSLIAVLENSFYTGNFSLSGFNDGSYNWNVRCMDSRNTGSSSVNGSFVVSAPDAPQFDGIGSKSVIENQTLTFSVSATDIDLEDANNLTYSAEQLPQGAVFDNGVFSWKPNFNQSGTYNVRFIVRDTKGLSDTMEVQVRVSDVKLPPRFDDAKQCNVKNSSIVLDITKPTSSNFDIGDDVNLEVKIKNNLKEDEKFKVYGYLYDASDEKSIEDNDVKISIKDGNTEKQNLTINIPSDIDLDHEYMFYFYVESSDDCNSVFKEINIERQRDSLEISKFDVVPVDQTPGGNLALKIKVENTGTRDQDVYIEIKNTQLGLNIKSPEFTVESYGDKDSITKSFNFIIPQNISNGEYTLTAKVYSDDVSVEKTKVLRISAVDSSSSVVSNVDSSGNTVTYQAGSGNTTTYQVGTTSVISGDTTTYLINVESVGEDSVSNSFEPVLVSSERVDLRGIEDIETEHSEIEKQSFKEKLGDYAKNPVIRSLLNVLNIFLIIGIITFVICLVLAVRRRM